ncbi:ATP synthase A1 subunit C [Nanoarchaeota archaeon]
MRLRENPYVYVRTRVMKTSLLRRSDYDKILKMELGEISRFLEESIYKKEIDEFASKLSGVDLLESALDANLQNSMAKLKRISGEDLEKVINLYLRRWDFENIKTIIRGIVTNADPNVTKDFLVPIGDINESKINELLNIKDVEELIKKSGLVAVSNAKEIIGIYNKKGTSFLENELDQIYYNEVLAFVEILPKTGTLFRDFLNAEVEIKNLITLVRLVRNEVSKDIIHKSLIKVGDDPVLPNSKVFNSKDLDELFGNLKKTPYQKIAKESLQKFNETKSLIDFENDMKRHLLGKTTLLSHQYPLSIDVILGFMFSKELEVENLKTIIRGKQLGLEEDFISSQLVVA